MSRMHSYQKNVGKSSINAPRYIAEDGRGLVAVTMQILRHVVGLGVSLVTPGSEVKCNVEIVDEFLIGLDGQPEVVVPEGLTDVLLDIFNLPRCCNECSKPVIAI